MAIFLFCNAILFWSSRACSLKNDVVLIKKKLRELWVDILTTIVQPNDFDGKRKLSAYHLVEILKNRTNLTIIFLQIIPGHPSAAIHKSNKPIQKEHLFY